MVVLSKAQQTDHSVAIETLIETYFQQNIASARHISPYYEALWREMHRLITSGGKRLRPIMVALAYEVFGGKETETILPIAISTELLHMSMLIHDDIIDRDFTRYGVANIAGAYQDAYAKFVSDDLERLHFASSAALLAGDLLISGAYQQILEAQIAPEKIIAVQKLIGRSIFEVAGGELLDTEVTFRPLGEIPATTIALYKTASYTFIGPLLTGALLADATIAQQQNLRVFAENIGVAFQLRDDILGVFGDEAITGKSSLGDLREGKRTYIVEQFYALASDAQTEAFDSNFGKKSLTQRQAMMLKDLLIVSGALDSTEKAIATYETRAHAALDSLSMRAVLRDRLDSFVATTLHRKK